MQRRHIAELMRYERPMFGTEAWSAAAYREELADHQHRYYLAAVDGDDALQGWAGMRVIERRGRGTDRRGDPAARKQGSARALLAGLLDEARRREVADVFLDVRVDNDDAQRIYRAMASSRSAGAGATTTTAAWTR